MNKTLDKLLLSRPWISHIDDERGDDNGIIVTLKKDYVFDDERDCGVRGFDTVAEVKAATVKFNVYRTGK
jgi:hypothetical protein